MLAEVVVFLMAAVIAVPIAQKLRLGSVLGYLLAGVVIGPNVLGLIGEVEDVTKLGEFGVTFLLFIIGLEMQPRRLWALRRAVLGLGGLQVLITGLLFTGLAMPLLNLPAGAATVAGFALALSSTAVALQILSERGQMTSRHGRAAFAILLFQDMAVIPIMALIPLMSVGHAEISWSGGLIETAKVAATIGVLVVGGHYVLKPVLRIVAASRVREIFTAMTLLIVCGTALIMTAAGISVALGAFVSGMLLADSEYRHELEANVDPFKDLLLGLFFISVGMSINLELFATDLLSLIGLTLGLVAIKIGVIMLLARRHGMSWAVARKLAAYVGQGGEFVFVILSVAMQDALFSMHTRDMLVDVVTLSMAITPFLVAGANWLNKRLAPAQSSGKAYEKPPAESNHPVIIAGIGRVGGTVARMLRAKNIGYVALEMNPDQVNFVRRFGGRIYYGDGSRSEVLHAAGAEEARVLVLAVGDPDISMRTVQMVQTHFPHLTIIARARDRRHAYQLLEAGVQVFQRDTFLASVQLAGDTMKTLGLRSDEIEYAKRVFRKHDENWLVEHYHFPEEQRMKKLAREATAELEELFERGDEASTAEAQAEAPKNPKTKAPRTKAHKSPKIHKLSRRKKTGQNRDPDQ